MKKVLFVLGICALCVSCTNGSNSNKNGNNYSNGNNQMQSQPSDFEITTNVKKALMTDSSLSSNARMISVTTNDGVVTLSGTVATNEEGRKVVRMVKNIPGVLDVDNQLYIANSK